MGEKTRRKFHMNRNSWGAQAERKVFRMVRELGKDFAVLNNVQTRYGNIDHVVIRRDGTIFLIETKSQRGRVTCDGKQLLCNNRPFKRNYISQIVRNTLWLKERIKTLAGLKVWVVSILIFPNGSIDACRGKKRQTFWMSQRIYVIVGRSLVSFLKTYEPGTRSGRMLRLDIDYLRRSM